VALRAVNGIDSGGGGATASAEWPPLLAAPADRPPLLFAFPRASVTECGGGGASFGFGFGKPRTGAGPDPDEGRIQTKMIVLPRVLLLPRVLVLPRFPVARVT
jgi:hypothetical protein